MAEPQERVALDLQPLWKQFNETKTKVDKVILDNAVVTQRQVELERRHQEFVERTIQSEGYIRGKMDAQVQDTIELKSEIAKLVGSVNLLKYMIPIVGVLVSTTAVVSVWIAIRTTTG